MGRFVARLDEAALSGCVQALGDEDLLRVVFVMEGDERLTSVFEMVGAERAKRMLAAAQTSGLARRHRTFSGACTASPARTTPRLTFAVPRIQSAHPGSASSP